MAEHIILTEKSKIALVPARADFNQAACLGVAGVCLCARVYIVRVCMYVRV
jgi:hypothetical protein